MATALSAPVRNNTRLFTNATAKLSAGTAAHIAEVNCYMCVMLGGSDCRPRPRPAVAKTLAAIGITL